MVQTEAKHFGNEHPPLFESPALDPFPRVPDAGGGVPKPGRIATMGFFTGKPGRTQVEEAGPAKSAPERPHISSNGAAGAHKALWKLLLQRTSRWASEPQGTQTLTAGYPHLPYLCSRSSSTPHLASFLLHSA